MERKSVLSQSTFEGKKNQFKVKTWKWIGTFTKTNSAFWSLPSAVLHCFPQRMSPGLLEEDSELRIEPRFDFDGSLKRLRPLGHLATQLEVYDSLCDGKLLQCATRPRYWRKVDDDQISQIIPSCSAIATASDSAAVADKQWIICYFIKRLC